MTASAAARTARSAAWTGEGESQPAVLRPAHGVRELALLALLLPTPLLALAAPSAAQEAWAPTSTVGAPAARYDHSALWTGSQMVVWGGYRAAGYTNTGGVYDPATDTWAAVSTTNAPSGRVGHTAVWTGSRMIVWGGVRRHEPHEHRRCLRPGHRHVDSDFHDERARGTEPPHGCLDGFADDRLRRV
jgi:hypothetical protein